MGRTYDEIIAEQAGKSITLTIEELQDFHRDAFFDGHRSSKYEPNLNGSCKMYFVNSDVFEKLKAANSESVHWTWEQAKEFCRRKEIQFPVEAAHRAVEEFVKQQKDKS